MTKTCTAVVPYRSKRFCPPVMMPSAQILEDQVVGILSFGHWNLFEIWFLVLGIFVVVIKQETFLLF